MLWLLAGAVAVVQGRLESSDISIELAERSAVVEARYRIVDSNLPIRFVLIKLQGQHVRLEGMPTDSTIVGVQAQAGAYEFTVMPSSSGGRTVSVRYEVSGNLERIPILNPAAPTDPARSTVVIRVRGVPSDAAIGDAFPRLTREPSGVVSATLENVPSVVRLPVAEGEWSTNRLADASVALLVLLSSVLWLLRQRAVRALRPVSGQ
ncbi:MAG: hypothetical protein ACE5HT_04370 [Gemmatimonadales bacterium]